MMGVTPQQAARFIEKSGAHVAALNCGTGMDMAGAAKIAAIYRSNCALPVMVQPNAGLPILEGGRSVYKQQPKDMAAGVPQVLAAGAGIVGSCCGSGPEHTRAISLAVAKCKNELYNYSPIGRNHPA
jgi:5-methyltetrahydrofolate--homocysteine methyltransferase